MRCVLLLASGARWETEALEVLDRASGTVVLKRCVDLDDLLASAMTGQAEFAVLAADTVGLDAVSVAHLVRHGLLPVVVVDDAGPAEQFELLRHRLAGMGVTNVVSSGQVRTLPEALAEQEVQPPPGTSSLATVGLPSGPEAAPEGPSTPGRVIAVWGPVGAPGRTTMATALAAEVAHRGRPCLLVDADPHAAVAQHLGVLDQVSGLLSAVRVARAGGLVERLPGLCRGLSDDLAVLTGLPRPDRAAEIEAGLLAEVVDACRTWGDVVVDCGSALADDRTQLVAGSSGLFAADVLGVADVVVAVGAADPVGLARLARGLGELREHVDHLQVPVHVVVNRMRSGLGWSRSEVRQLVEGFVATESVHVLPDDRVAADRALVAGRPVTYERSSGLAQGVADLLVAVHPGVVAVERSGRVPAPRGWFRQRRAGTTHRR